LQADLVVVTSEFEGFEGSETLGGAKEVPLPRLYMIKNNPSNFLNISNPSNVLIK